MQALTFAAVLLFFSFPRITEERGASPGVTAAEAESGVIRPALALTFDDGPHEVYTEELLDGLAERNVRATFFVVGENVRKGRNSEIIKRMEEEGHLIGNHTYHHADLSALTGEEAAAELDAAGSLISGITGKPVWIVRPPYGALPAETPEDGNIYVRWTLDSLDWSIRDTDRIVDKVVSEVKENDIILMHDCYETSVEAALKLTDILKAEGYRFVTLDHLLGI